MPEKMAYLDRHYNYIRSGLMNEPRGHKDMFGAFLLDPAELEADFGIVYMCGYCYENMCGHNTIGFAVAAVERNMVEVTEPITRLKLDTPAGLIEVVVHVKDGLAAGVDFINVPTFIYKKDVVLDVPSNGAIRCGWVFWRHSSCWPGQPSAMRLPVRNTVLATTLMSINITAASMCTALFYTDSTKKTLGRKY